MRIGYDAKRIFHNTTGLGNYSRDLVRIMAEYYPRNTYFLYNPKPGKVKRLIPDGSRLREITPGAPYYLFPSLWRTFGLTARLKHDRIDLYHGLTGELPAGISKSGIPSVVTIHDLIFMYFPGMYKAIDRYLYLKKFRYAARHADKVVAISQKTKDDIVKYLGTDERKIQVIYQGCHPVFKRNIAPEVWERLQNTHSLPGDFILYVGAVNERKNALTIVKSLRDKPYPLLIVGSGNRYFRTVKQYVADNGMQKRVFFLQHLDMEQIAMLYRKARIFIYPSLFEGFGIPIIEALYSKTPVITTSGGVFPEAGGPESIYLSNPLDTGEMSEQIDRLWNDAGLRKIISESGYRYVQKFNDETIAAKWHQLYDEIRKEKK